LEDEISKLRQMVDDCIQEVSSVEHPPNVTVEHPGDDDDTDEQRQEYQSFLFNLLSYEAPQRLLLNVAPGADNTPMSIWSHPFVEELCFPSLFGGKVRQIMSKNRPDDDKREVSYKEICKMELFNGDRRFARNIENLFFKFYFSEVKTLHSVL
jgi:hypothetical protein